MVMDRMMESKSINDKLVSIAVLITDQINLALKFCRGASKITHFKISFSYDIKTYNSGSIGFSKTWEEGEKNV
jgi:hypothetical protein